MQSREVGATFETVPGTASARCLRFDCCLRRFSYGLWSRTPSIAAPVDPHGYDIVAAAGHYGGRGGSSNVNAFGNDLDNNGLRWTRAMCMRDR